MPAVPRAAARRVLLGALVAGLLADLAGRHGIGTLAGALALGLGALVVLAVSRPRSPVARGAIAGAVVFAPWLALRDSHWLLPLDIVAGAGLVVFGCTVIRRPTLTDSFAGLALRAVQAAYAALHGPVWLWGCLRAVRPRTDPPQHRLGRAVLWAGPVLFAVGALLVSADALMARWLAGAVDGTGWTRHAVLVLAGGLGLISLHAVSRVDVATGAGRDVLHRRQLEAAVVLAGMVALLAVFAAAQLVAAARGAAYVQARTGLTYAAYARRGFFQLLAVGALTFVLLASLRPVLAGATPMARRALRLLALAVVALAEVLVAVAVRRLALYEDAFGLTMLRLYSTVFAWWLGVVLLLAAAAVVRPTRRAWLVPAVALAALAGVAAMNVVDPESVVVRHDIARAERTGQLDVAYLVRLSDDATPALVAAARTASPALAASLRAGLCDPAVRHHDRGDGLASNRADRRSREALDQLCDP